MMTNHGFTPLKIVKVIQENYRTRSFFLEDALPSAAPGQYVMAWLPGIGEKPFSVAGNFPLKITVVTVGPVSSALYALQPGERIWIRGPLGCGYRPSGRRHLLVGGGYGAAPLLFLAQNLLAEGGEVQVCLGARSQQDLLLADQFERLGCRVSLTTDDGSMGRKGLVTEAVLSAIADAAPDALYACGPVPMLTAVAQLCTRRGLHCQLSWEAIIRCGMGLCGSCELDADISRLCGMPEGWLTCKDGPVFIRE